MLADTLSAGDIAAIVTVLIAVCGAMGKLASILVVRAVDPKLTDLRREMSEGNARVHRRIDDHMIAEEAELRAANATQSALARQVARICGHLGLPID